jgi:hypothetical protein
MNSYIIPNFDENDRQMLHEHGVVFFPWAEGIIFDHTQLQKSLQLLGARATQQPSDIEQVFLLTLHFDPISVARAAADSPSAAQLPSRQRANPSQTKRQLDGSQSDTNHSAARRHYIEICSSRLKDLTVQSEEKIAQRKLKLASAQDHFIETMRKHFVGKAKLTEEAIRSSSIEQFERLLLVDKVRTVRVTSGAILIYTDMLYATDPATGSRRELGCFLIIIDTNGTNDGVRWLNLTRRIRTVQPGMNAPRVFEDGKAFVDEVKETLLELIAQFEFATVAELAIQFVETVSDDPLSNFINKWPEAGAPETSS